MPAAARASSAVYWSNALGGSLAFANLDGSGGRGVDLNGTAPITPEGVTIDPASGRIYWADRGANRIEWAELAGGESGVLNTSGATVDEPMGIVIGPFDRSIFWANHGASSISWARLDGSGGGDLQIPLADVEKPVGLADSASYPTGLYPVAPSARERFESQGFFEPRELVWTTGGEHAGIYAADIKEEPGDPAGPVRQVQTGSATVAAPSGIAVAEGRVYWANGQENASHRYAISFASLTGGAEAGDLQTGGAVVDRPSGVALDPGADRIYWVNAGSPGIEFAGLDGRGASGAVPLGGAPLAGPAFLALSELPQPTQVVLGGLPTDPADVFPISGLRWLGGANPPWAGSALICDPTYFSWDRDLPGAFLLRAPTHTEIEWTRGGLGVAVEHFGLGILRATEPGSYRCAVTASNIAGVTSLVSNAVTVVPAPPLLLEHLAETYARFAVEPRATALTGFTSRHRLSPRRRRYAGPRGTTFSFTLSRGAVRVAIEIERASDGRRVRGRCVSPVRRSLRRARCTLYRGVVSLARRGQAGANRVSFSGRTPQGALRPGRYRAVFGASDEYGSSPKEAIDFVVVHG